ncbi:MAG TPA: hypothetical protein VL026_10645 [Rhizomicrobium sp.]|nr:hypothetical protein [Rhizomicrobium sp.]
MSDAENKKLFGIRPIWVAVAATVVVLGAVGGYFALNKTQPGGTEPAQTASADAQPNGVCGAALARVRDYGVVPFNATLSSNADGTKAENGRIACSAKSGEETYSMLVNVSCSDLNDENCLEIFRVTQGDGNALFQKRAYSF